ncbi:hypothetical protein V1527DRAFT_455887 [Lipomyces starkeyi]
MGRLQSALSTDDERDVLLPTVSGGQLAGCFYASRSGAGNHDGLCDVNLLLKQVQSREGLFVCADGFERQVAADLGAGSDDELVVGERELGSVVSGHLAAAPTSANPRTTRDEVQTGYGMAKGTSESPQVSDEFMDTSNGDLVVGTRFWTVFCREIYMDNVDPFMKVLHVPTMTKVIRELRGSYHSLGPNMQALLLVISLAAITSLEEEEVHVNFNTDKDQLVARYRLSTEQAPEQADFRNNPDIIVLQALTIYLGVRQHTGETRYASSIRNPKICMFLNTNYRKGLFDTEIPANTDDANLDTLMSKPPVVAERWTDMTVFLIRCEVWSLSRQLQSITAPDIVERLELFRQSQARIEDTYLKHLNPSQPLHSFAATTARLFLTEVDLILHTKQHSARATEPQSTDTSQNDKVFMWSLSIIEYTYALQNEPGWNGWSWQIQGRQPPWYALTRRARPVVHAPLGTNLRAGMALS